MCKKFPWRHKVNVVHKAFEVLVLGCRWPRPQMMEKNMSLEWAETSSKLLLLFGNKSHRKAKVDPPKQGCVMIVSEDWFR